jgi:2-methylcitrate dehydratase PrpD
VVDDVAADLASWALDLDLGNVPEHARRSAAALRASTAGAGAWTLTHPVAHRILDTARSRASAKDGLPIPGSGPRVEPREAAAAWAGLSVAQDFDDTLLGGHVSHSAVWVPLLAGAARGKSGAEVAAAQVAASEVAARLGTAGAVGELRGQMTVFVHAAASAVARARLEDRGPEAAARALRAALEAPRVPHLDGFLGGDGKHRAVRDPVREGWDAVDDVAAGYEPATGSITSEEGFLAAVCDHPLPEFLGGLGTRWHLSAPTVKAHPACYYALAPVEAALELADSVDPDEVAAVAVEASLLTVEMDDASASHVRGPGTPLPALNFTVGWNVAAALADGEHTPRQLHPDRVDDASTWRLARSVDVAHDADRTARVLEADIPVGLPMSRVGPKVAAYAAGVLGLGTAVRNARLLVPLLRKRPLPDDLAEATKVVGARVRAELEDGPAVEAEVEQPVGSAGRGLDEAEAVARRKARRGLEAGLGAGEGLVDRLVDLPDLDADEVRGLVHDLAGGK